MIWTMDVKEVVELTSAYCVSYYVHTDNRVHEKINGFKEILKRTREFLVENMCSLEKILSSLN